MTRASAQAFLQNGHSRFVNRDHAGAAESYRIAFTMDPTLTAALGFRGNALRCLGRYEECISVFDALLALKPGEAAATLNKAIALGECGRAEEGLALTEGFNAPEALMARAVLLLRLGRYAEAWPLYRARNCIPQFGVTAKCQRPMPETIADLRGKRCVVFQDEGLGDALQFVRYLPMLRLQAASVHLVVSRPLVRLFADMADTVSTSRDGLEYDLDVPMMDLPALFGTTLDTIPNTIPYLPAPKETFAGWSPEPEKINVGVVWSGLRRPYEHDPNFIDGRRSVGLDVLAPVLRVPGTAMHSLQLGPPADDHVPTGVALSRPIDAVADLLDTASIVRRLDLVITVDTAIAHLSAALGVETWVLSRYDGCWRWMGQETSPWYPAVLRLFHQPRPGDWASPVLTVARLLEQRCRA